MATTTPNFGWPVPTSTDLVKDGATAIEALGDGIDTSLVDLKGGTTGQVLSKTTGADMDFTWVTTDDANAIQNSIVDAKGDIVAASANDTPARLAAGANGQVLVADSTTTTGLRYQSGYDANAIINGGFDIAQRGTSINTAASTFAYTLDRLWVFSNGPAVTTSQQVTGDTTNLPNIQYCARLQRQSGQTATTLTLWNMPVETKDSIRFVGQTVTISFYARKSGTYTAGLTGVLLSGTGTDQSGLGNYTGQATVASATTTLTTTWTRYQATGTVSASATQIGVQFSTGSWVGTAGASDYVEITGVQVELGSIATNFKRAGGGTMQQELAACQRYYYRIVGGNGGAPFGSGQCASTTAAVATMSFPVTMRIRPTALEQSGTAGDYKLYRAGTADENCTAVPTFNNSSPNQAVITATVAANIVAGNATIFSSTNATAYLGWSAEL